MKRVALITGSTSGIGLGLAKHFAKEGYNIMLNGLEENGHELAKNMATTYNVDVKFNGANLLNAYEIEELVNDTIKSFGRVDVLINNAGIQNVKPIKDFPNEMYEKIISINMNSSFYTIKAAWPYFEKQGFGRIINISSVHGIRASEYKIAYVAAKHGVIGITKVAALEGANKNITCNAICPGYVKTPLVENQIVDQAKAHNMSQKEVVEKVMLKKQAVKEFISIEAIAKQALLLSSPMATAITGTTFTLDGGWSAQ